MAMVHCCASSQPHDIETTSGILSASKKSVAKSYIQSLEVQYQLEASSPIAVRYWMSSVDSTSGALTKGPTTCDTLVRSVVSVDW